MQLDTLGLLELPGTDFREEKPLLLLAYLAHQAPDRWLKTEQVAALIWPYSKDAVHNLDQAVHSLYKYAGARNHIKRRSGSIKVMGLATDAQALMGACQRRDLARIKQLYAGGQFLQSVNPDQYTELYDMWLRPQQERVQAAVWRAYLDASVVDPAKAAENLRDAYTLTTVLPVPSSDDFLRCVCLQRLFGHEDSLLSRSLQQEIDDLNIDALPTSDEAARAFLNLRYDHETHAPATQSTNAAQETASQREPSRPLPTLIARFKIVIPVVLVSFLAIGLSIWGRKSAAVLDTDIEQSFTSAELPLTPPFSEPRLDVPLAEALLAKLPSSDHSQVALLLAVEAAYSLQPVAAGSKATETLRERLLGFTEPWQTRLAHNVLHLAYSPDERWLIVAGEDSVAQLWDMQGAREEPFARLQHGDTVTAAMFTASSDYVITGSSDEQVRRWNLHNLAQPPQVFAHESTVYAVAESPDGRWLATGTRDGKVRLWSLEAADTPPIALRDHVGWVTSLAFSRDGRWLFTGGDQRGINLYRLQGNRGAPVAEAITLLEAGTIRFGQDLPLVISPDSQWAAAGRPDSGIHLFELTDPERKQVILQGHSDHVQSLIFSPDGRWLASGSRDGDVRIWDMAGDRDVRVLQGHNGWVMTLGVSKNGRYLLSGSDDATVRLWDLAVNPPDVRVFSDHPHQVRAVALNSVGWLATGSYEGDVLVQNLMRSRFDLPQASTSDLITMTCEVVGRDLTRQEWADFIGDVAYQRICF